MDVDVLQMTRIRQNVDAPRERDIAQAVRREMDALALEDRIRQGASIAVTAGSRGISNIDVILRQVVCGLQDRGAKPFLVAAMGSHGGGTAQGQVEILESLGITRESVGAPIVSAMEVVEIGRSRFGNPVWMDRNAAAADGVVVVNRIKPHTEFEGPIESGLMKMLAIGLGKHKGCLQVHQQTVQHGYRDVIPAIGGVILEKLPVLFGVGIVENIHDQTAIIRGAAAENIAETEARLLEQAKQLMARLPFDQLDVLIIDEMGKNISGTGMDTNVIGRIMFIGEREPERPRITRIVVMDLTDASHGNASGVGLADYIPQRLADKIDRKVVSTNCIAAMTPEKGRIPITLSTDREAVHAALQTIGTVEPARARVVHIRNTLELGTIAVSDALLAEAAKLPQLEIIGESAPLAFHADGTLVRLADAHA
jgi:hypothetical protein